MDLDGGEQDDDDEIEGDDMPIFSSEVGALREKTKKKERKNKSMMMTD